MWRTDLKCGADVPCPVESARSCVPLCSDMSLFWPINISRTPTEYNYGHTATSFSEKTFGKCKPNPDSEMSVDLQVSICKLVQLSHKDIQYVDLYKTGGLEGFLFCQNSYVDKVKGHENYPINKLPVSLCDGCLQVLAGL